MDDVFRALADETRRRLLDRLHAEPGATLSELAEPLDMTRQAVSKHLALLEAAGLVVSRWAGREKHHYLNPVPLVEIHERWISKFAAQRARRLLELRRALEEKEEPR
ncbi:MAG TPA: metalloregulator ArsR/SmtB family transcription factor [Myxococcota bacterium]|nr:metalloregulator ArsR/SmtB family transcription factor [Myxococcota bacterium]